jgi:hypothetical protein
MHHRGRTRGRLRAVLVETDPEAVRLALAPRNGLFARTAATVRIYAWGRACQVIERRQLPTWEESLTPPCAPPDPIAEPFSGSQRRTLQSWLLLVIMRGRWFQLEHWVKTGHWKKRPDSGWGRLLQEQLPATLKDPEGGYHRLRAELALEFGFHTERIRPVLAKIGSTTKGDRQHLREILLAVWDEAVPFPKRLSPDFYDNAASALSDLDFTRAEDDQEP